MVLSFTARVVDRSKIGRDSYYSHGNPFLIDRGPSPEDTPLALPGAYAGLILSMLLTGNRLGPGDPYSWLLFAAPNVQCMREFT
jgi:hypothetical protein